MTDSLRDQLLGLGFKPAPKPAPKPSNKPQRHHGAKPAPAHAKGRPGEGARAPGKPHGARPKPRREEIDLAKAYAIRAQKEKDERIEAERQKQEAARLRREARAKLDALLQGKALNREDADIARHFPYGGKIKRIYVTADQLKALNAGETGVVQLNGRYLLVARETLQAAETVFAEAIALKIDPDAPAPEDPYADPEFQVPDDLVW